VAGSLALVREAYLLILHWGRTPEPPSAPIGGLGAALPGGWLTTHAAGAAKRAVQSGAREAAKRRLARWEAPPGVCRAGLLSLPGVARVRDAATDSRRQAL